VKSADSGGQHDLTSRVPSTPEVVMSRALVLWYSIAGRVLPGSLPVHARAGHEKGSPDADR
jgi:hypothetical protein